MGSSSTERKLNTGPVGGALGSDSDSSGVVGESFEQYLEWLDDAEAEAAGAGEPPMPEGPEMIETVCAVCGRSIVIEEHTPDLCYDCDKAAHEASPYEALVQTEPTYYLDGSACAYCGDDQTMLSDEGLCFHCHDYINTGSADVICAGCGEQYATLMPLDWRCLVKCYYPGLDLVPQGCLCPSCAYAMDQQHARIRARIEQEVRYQALMQLDARCEASGCKWAHTGVCTWDHIADMNPYDCPGRRISKPLPVTHQDNHGKWTARGTRLWVYECYVTDAVSVWQSVRPEQMDTEVAGSGMAGQYLPDGTPLVLVSSMTGGIEAKRVTIGGALYDRFDFMGCYVLVGAYTVDAYWKNGTRLAGPSSVDYYYREHGCVDDNDVAIAYYHAFVVARMSG